MSLAQLPSDILGLVLAHAGLSALGAFEQLSKECHKISRTNLNIWREIFVTSWRLLSCTPETPRKVGAKDAFGHFCLFLWAVLHSVIDTINSISSIIVRCMLGNSFSWTASGDSYILLHYAFNCEKQSYS
jgi:hypothetical protein